MHEKNSINFLSYIPVCFLLLSCSTALDGVYTWDSFIKERSYDGDTFFAEATAPNGIISYGSSNDSQGAANNMASRHCSENSGKIFSGPNGVGKLELLGSSTVITGGAPAE